MYPILYADQRWIYLVKLAAVARIFTVAAMAFALGGCSSFNTWLAPTMADHMPAWAGGLPTGVPPRPGTTEYDDYSKRLEREPAQPASQNNASAKPGVPPEAGH
jgi:hypothetical protein